MSEVSSLEQTRRLRRFLTIASVRSQKRGCAGARKRGFHRPRLA